MQRVPTGDGVGEWENTCMSIVTRRRLLAGTAGTALAGAAGGTWADDGFPDRPVRFVMPAVAGTGADVMTRIILEIMTKQTGKVFVVDNKPGAGGAIGTQHAATQPPDGYTVVYGGPNITVLPAMNKVFAEKIDIRKVFEPLTIAASGPFVLVSNPRLPVNSIKDLVAWVRANPKTANFGSSGPGATTHLLAELIRYRLGGFEITNIPYRGDGLAVQAVADGDVAYAVAVSASTKSYVDAGTVRALAVTSATRYPGMPNVPTLAEAGNIPDFDYGAWLGFFTRAGTPPSRIAWLHRAMTSALKEPSIKARMDVLGLDVVASEPAALRAVVERDVKLWVDFAKKIGIEPI
jgi:tripartite-type tricarboxylate transporter receptor subunit TctC